MSTIFGRTLRRRLGLFAGTLVVATVAFSPSALAEQTPGMPVSDPLDPIIDNGSLVQMGINPAGNLNVGGGTFSMPNASTSNVGLRFIPTNGEATAPGCLCEGWGVANADGATGTFSGYANVAIDGVVNLTVQAGTGVYMTGGQIKAESVGTHFKSITTTGDGSGDRLRVTHDYHPSLTPNLYQVDVTIENIGATTVGDLRYRRVMDWDIAPATFYEWVEIHVGTATDVIRAHTDGFHSANPLSIFGPGVGSPPTTLVSGDPDYLSGASDQGALFDFGFGSLAPGASRSFKTYYGAAETRTLALAALAVVGAEVYSFGLPSVSYSDGSLSPDGTPHAFIFAFGEVGGTPIGDVKTRMTGGGSVSTSDGTRVTHGFELHCDASKGPNNLQVNWGKGNRFHLTDLASAACTDDGSISEDSPVAGFDTYKGKGTGTYNGVAGATAEWTFTDAGEPGSADYVSLTIKDAGANIVLSVTGTLSNGNHQAHAS